MPPKFGNYLFRNLKGPTGDAPAAPAEPTSLDGRELVLTEADFVAEEALVPALAWDQWPAGEVRLLFGDTHGLMSGRVTVAAGVLRRVAPPLVPPGVPDDLELPVSLKTVVLQLGPYLPAVPGGSPRLVAPDFDTPIAQVAREDEGFFKLEQGQEQGGPTAFVGPVPLIRERPRDPQAESPTEGEPVLPPPLPVRVPRPPPPDLPTAAEGAGVPFNPFASLPSVGPPPSGAVPAPVTSEGAVPAVPASPLPAATPPMGASSDPPRTVGRPLPSGPERPVVPNSGFTAAAGALPPLRRQALERLQEIFMTDDYLDVEGVLRCVRAFPRVRAASIVLADGTWHGDREGTVGMFGPSILEALNVARRLADTAAHGNFRGFTLLGPKPLSVIGDGRLAIVLRHDGRALPPGMQERVGAVAEALADLLAEVAGL